MSLDVAKILVKQIENSKNKRITVLFHSGEPLACGYEHFYKTAELFENLIEEGKVLLAIQTNATLINDEWCKLFKKFKFEIGVSLDGPEWANQNRVNWKDRETFNQTINGINLLKKHNIEFGIIAVVDKNSIERGSELYDFFYDLKCSWLGFNIEEFVGTNKTEYNNEKKVEIFWATIFEEWNKKPKFNIREITRVIEWIRDIEIIKTNFVYDIFPSINIKGDYVLLSPEFLDMKSQQYDDFIVGNIATKNLFDLEDMLDIEYVRDFISGIKQCGETCEVFNYCQGGQASNKYYENGEINSTKTNYCLNSRIIPAKTIIN